MSNLHTAFLLKKLRTDYGYTIQDVADMIGVSKTSISKWESGDHISVEHLYNMSKIYNITFDELLNGKLNEEDNNIFWRRNYDLNEYDKLIIKVENIEIIKQFYEHCAMVIDRFFELLPRWATNELNSSYVDEFNYIKKFFVFDSNYYVYKKLIKNIVVCINEETEKKFTAEILNEITDKDDKFVQWELRKIFNFSYDRKSDEVCQSGNLKALEYMLSTYSQIEKDQILYFNLHIQEEKEMDSIFGKTKQICKRDMTTKEIEEKEFFKIIINSGANCLFPNKLPDIIWEKELEKKIEGEKKEINIEIYKKYNSQNTSGETLVPILNNWKIFTYEDYLLFIDKEETEKLKDIVNIKNNNPIEYYKKMIKRG